MRHQSNVTFKVLAVLLAFSVFTFAKGKRATVFVHGAFQDGAKTWPTSPAGMPWHIALVTLRFVQLFLRCYLGTLRSSFADREHFLHRAIALVDRNVGVSVAIGV